MRLLPHCGHLAQQCKVFPEMDPYEAAIPSVLNIRDGGDYQRAERSTLGVSAAPLYSIQVPPVSKYSGSTDTEPFEEWVEQFELVASVCHWEG